MIKEFIELGLNRTPERDEADRREKVKRDIIEKDDLSPGVLIGMELHNNDEQEVYSVVGTVQDQKINISFNSFTKEFRGTIDGQNLSDKEAERLFSGYRDLNHELLMEAIADKHEISRF